MSGEDGDRLVLVLLGENQWELALPYNRYSQRLGRWIAVPQGTETDLASVPRLLLAVVDDDGPHARAAVIHDYIYRNPGLFPRISRKQADQIMDDLMAEDGVGRFKRWIIYRAVRLGGGRAWRKYR